MHPKSRSSIRRCSWVAALAALLLLGASLPGTGDTSVAQAQGKDPRFRPTLNDLEDVATLQAQFQADDGVPRLLLVLSPT